MTKRIQFFIYSTITLALMHVSSIAYSQQSDSDVLLSKGDELRTLYRFDESIEVYRQARDLALQHNDSIALPFIEDRILMSENGKSMTSFVFSPTVVARHRFSIDDFFLYYPLEDRSWRPVPNQLDTVGGHDFLRAMHASEGTGRMFWSAEDKDGIRNLYTSTLQDSLWTVPTLINEQMTTVSDEIYPLLSADGKHLYFSSAGLYGVGGYDLFVSDWNEDNQEWSAPENLGFPYSSPADDFLFYNSPDGRYTFFASNRDCSKDSVFVYVLEFDNMPVRKAIDDPEELMAVASLRPVSKTDRLGSSKVKADIPQNVDIRRYMDVMSKVRMLKDSISVYASRIGTEENVESRINILRDSLSRTQSELQKIEMDFLFKGVVIDPEKLMAEADREIVNEKSGYVFTKKRMGTPLELKVMEPEVKFDYSFKVLEEGQFAEDQTIPSGVVYQIQIFASRSKASLKNLKGLSPVYESKGANGNYVYRVGLFRTYNDVLANLNTVKRAGFKSAYIVPFIDGKVVKMATAKAREAAQKADHVFYEVRITPDGGSLDSAVSGGIRQQAGGKDIARVTGEDGATVYVVGPFDDKTKADALVDFVKAMGVSNVKTEKVK